MRLLFFASLLLVVFVCVPRALAVCDGCADPLNADMASSCDPSMSADDCMWAPMGNGIGGDYSSCTAMRALTQFCVTRVFSWEKTTNVCAQVSYSAHCKCDSFGAYGSCTYQQ